MGFLVTTLIFVVVGIIASLCVRICCNAGPPTNLNPAPYIRKKYMEKGKIAREERGEEGLRGFLFYLPEFIDWVAMLIYRLHLTLVITATVCCWMMWAIVYLAQMKPLIVPILNESE